MIGLQIIIYQLLTCYFISLTECLASVEEMESIGNIDDCSSVMWTVRVWQLHIWCMLASVEKHNPIGGFTIIVDRRTWILFPIYSRLADTVSHRLSQNGMAWIVSRCNNQIAYREADRVQRSRQGQWKPHIWDEVQNWIACICSCCHWQCGYLVLVTPRSNLTPRGGHKCCAIMEKLGFN